MHPAFFAVSFPVYASPPLPGEPLSLVTTTERFLSIGDPRSFHSSIIHLRAQRSTLSSHHQRVRQLLGMA
jgi:hypothetical protein